MLNFLGAISKIEKEFYILATNFLCNDDGLFESKF
jgi:hypothetical protein